MHSPKKPAEISAGFLYRGADPGAGLVRDIGAGYWRGILALFLVILRSNKKNQKKSLSWVDFYFYLRYNNSKAKQRNNQNKSPDGGRKGVLK